MDREPAPGTLGARLRSARKSSFVGREEEVSRFRAVLERPDPAIVWMYAPGGTGKSALLRELGEIALAQACCCVEIDFASCEASPAAIFAMIGSLFFGESCSSVSTARCLSAFGSPNNRTTVQDHRFPDWVLHKYVCAFNCRIRDKQLVPQATSRFQLIVVFDLSRFDILLI